MASFDCWASCVVSCMRSEGRRLAEGEGRILLERVDVEATRTMRENEMKK